MTKVKETEVGKLLQDNKNFNKGTQYGDHLMEESISRFGLGRSILIDKHDRIIAGNKTAQKAGELGIEKVLVVETTGDTIVAVKRVDVDLDTRAGRELALADNATGKANLSWDVDVLNEVAQAYDFAPEDWGVRLEEVAEETCMTTEEKATARLSKLEYTSMYYEPKNIPNIRLQDCYDIEKFNAKIKVIEESGLSEEQKQIMKIFAYRFIKINFEAVANYYAFNASEEEKAVIERLRLVLVESSVRGFIEDDLLRIREDVMSTDLDWQTEKISGYDYED